MKTNLTRKDAQERAQLISNVHYDIAVDITGADEFTTVSTVTFDSKAGTTHFDLVAAGFEAAGFEAVLFAAVAFFAAAGLAADFAGAFFAGVFVAGAAFFAAGVVFARAENDADTGFALPIGDLAQALSGAAELSSPVPTGSVQCGGR